MIISTVKLDTLTRLLGLTHFWSQAEAAIRGINTLFGFLHQLMNDGPLTFQPQGLLLDNSTCN